MRDDIDDMIGADASIGAGDLAGLEDRVWSRIGDRRERVRMDQVRIAAVAAALLVGALNGGALRLASQPEASEMRVFTVSSGLSPMTSLDARG